MRKVACLLIVGLIAPAWAGNTENIKFRLVHDFLVVITGSIGPLQGLNFVVDTGASRSAVDNDVALRLGLSGHSDEVFMLGQSQPALRIDVADLGFGQISVASLSVLAVDLKPFARKTGTRIDGVLGLDVLRARNFAINYRRQQLEFGEVQVQGPAVPFDPTSPYLLVTALVSGQSIRLLVDTGINRMSVFADRLPRGLQHRRALAAPGTSAAESVKAGSIRDVDVRLGDWRVRETVLFVIRAGSDFREYDGHLGVRVLGAARVYFDFDHGQLHWEY